MDKQYNPIYFCYSPNQHRYLKENGLRIIGEGLHKTSGRPFWQYERGEELDRLLDEWAANRPTR